MVGLGGLEPPTSPLSGARSSHLSYRPWQTSEQTAYNSFSLRCPSVVCKLCTNSKLRWPRFLGPRLAISCLSSQKSVQLTAKVWEAENGKELLTLRGHSSLVSGVAFSPDGKRLATASGDLTASTRSDDRCRR